MEVYAEVTDPRLLTFGADGSLFVGRDNAGSGGGFTDAVRIHRVGPGGATVEEYGSSAIVDPDAVLVDANGVFGTAGAVLVGGIISNSAGGHIKAILPNQDVIGLFGPTTDYHNPTHFAFDGNGRLLFTNAAGPATSTNRGLFFTAGASQPPAPLFTSSINMIGLIVDDQNRILVSTEDGRIEIHESDGTLVDGSFVSGLGWGGPLVMGTLADQPAPSIYTFSSVGELVRVDPVSGATEVIGEGFVSPNDLDFGPDGALYISEFDNDRILRVTPSNQPPTADAGPDQSIHAGETVLLDGSGSFDDNTAQSDLVYAWSFVAQPAGSIASLDDPSSVTPRFLADLDGTFALQLVVTDQEGATSDPDLVEISSENLAPTAVAMASSELVAVGELVDLDGSASFDPEDDPLNYSWSLASAPGGSGAVLGSPDTAFATLVPDVEGTYEIVLEVADFLGPGAPATILVTAVPDEVPVEFLIMEACDIVAGLSSDQVTSRGNQNAFCRHLRNAVTQANAGRTAKAVDTLSKAIGRTDGCALRGSVDGNGPGRDWIIECTAQLEVHELLDLARASLGE